MTFYTIGFEDIKKLFDTFIKDIHFRELMFEIFIKCEILSIKQEMENKIESWLKEGFYDRI